MEFYYIKLLKYLLKIKNLKAAEMLIRLIDILNTFTYIKGLLHSRGYRSFRFEKNLSYHIENFYMRVYVFREAFYLFLNAVFELGINEGDERFRLNIKNMIAKNTKLSFLLKALEELKKHDVIKKCLLNWRKTQHQAVKGYDFNRHIGLLEALGQKKLSETEKNEIVMKIFKQADSDIERVRNFSTDFLEQYCKEILLTLEKLNR